MSQRNRRMTNVPLTDVRRAGDVVDLRWVKARRKCGNPAWIAGNRLYVK